MGFVYTGRLGPPPSCAPAMVGLNAADGDNAVVAALPRIRNQELQLPHLCQSQGKGTMVMNLPCIISKKEYAGRNNVPMASGAEAMYQSTSLRSLDTHQQPVQR